MLILKEGGSVSRDSGMHSSSSNDANGSSSGGGGNGLGGGRKKLGAKAMGMFKGKNPAQVSKFFPPVLSSPSCIAELKQP